MTLCDAQFETLLDTIVQSLELVIFYLMLTKAAFNSSKYNKTVIS